MFTLGFEKVAVSSDLTKAKRAERRYLLERWEANKDLPPFSHERGLKGALIGGGVGAVLGAGTGAGLAAIGEKLHMIPKSFSKNPRAVGAALGGALMGSGLARTAYKGMGNNPYSGMSPTDIKKEVRKRLSTFENEGRGPFSEWDEIQRLEHVMDLEEKYGKDLPRSYDRAVQTAKSLKELNDLFHRNSVKRS